MKIIFSITNGLLLLFLLPLLFFIVLNLWELGPSDELLGRFYFIIFLTSLYLLNIYSFWRFPGLIVSAVQIVLNLGLIPLVLIARVMAVIVLVAILPEIDPGIDVSEISVPFAIAANVFIFHCLLTAGFIIFNMVKAFKNRKAD